MQARRAVPRITAAARFAGSADRWRARGAAIRDELVAMAPRLVATLGTSGVVAVLGIASGVIAARTLGPSSRGDLALLLLWPQLFCTVGNMGIDLAATYLSANPVRRANAPATLIAVALAQSLVLVPLYLLLMPFVFDGARLTGAAMLMATLIPLYLGGAYCVAALGGMLDFRAFNVVRFATPALYVATIVALALTGTLSAITAAAGFVLANGVADALAFVLLCRKVTFARPDIALAKSALAYGARAHVGRLSPQSLGADAIIIALLLSSRDLGLFVAAAAFLAAPRLLTASVSMVAFPQVSAAHVAGVRPKLRALFTLYVLAATLPAIALFTLASPIVALLFGGEFGGAAPVLRLLALSAMAMSLRAFPLEVLRGVGRPGITSIAEIANWGLFVVAVPAGVAIGGLQGAAAGVAVSSFGSLAVIAVLSMRSGVFARDMAPGHLLAPAEVPCAA